AGVAIREEDLDAGLPIRERRVIAYQLWPIAGAGPHFAGLDRPAAVVGTKTFERRVQRRLLETLAEDHLAVDAAVDFVIDVLDAGARQMRADAPADITGIDSDGGLRMQIHHTDAENTKAG